MRHCMCMAGFFYRVIFCLLMSLALTGPANAVVINPLSPNSELQQHLTSQLSLFSEASVLAELEQIAHVKRLYASRQFQPVWSDMSGLLPTVAELFKKVDLAEQHGLSGIDVHRDLITFLSTSRASADRAKLDILLTDSFMLYVLAMGEGQVDPASIDKGWRHAIREIDPVYLLQDALQNHRLLAVLNSVEPRSPQYKSLLAALSLYRQIETIDGWPMLPALDAALVYGSGETVTLNILRKQLRLTGDLASAVADESMFDYELEQAVRKFQKRHGLMVDGAVGRQTRAALNVPIRERIEQLVMNLERWRWLPRELGERHLLVNTADFSLQAFTAGQPALSMKVIVGKKKRKTPLFSEMMTYLVVNPYWNVPTKLAVKDLIPKELKHAGYLNRHHIRVLSGWDKNASELDLSSIDFSEYQDRRYLPFRFRQDPGNGNSLGRIKFMFPNAFSVYMHDTPSRGLFNRTVRTFSSGCVRLEKPLKLARFLMGEGGMQRINHVLRSGENRRIALPEPVAVHLIYQTAWMDEQGDIQFRPDVYRKDALLKAAMSKDYTHQTETLAQASGEKTINSVTHKDHPVITGL
ncbi:MAG: L,D-transpeptidase family protein [Gammaproteobacteria bacterium]